MSLIPLVHIVEDDTFVCRALSHLFTSVNMETACYQTPAACLEQLDPTRPGCMIIDVRLPGMSGLELTSKIRANNWTHPVVFLTGHGDVQTAVRAMKLGAVDFILKPHNEQLLVETVTKAALAHVEAVKTEQNLKHIRQRLESLSPREQEVLNLVVEGKPTKQIAAELRLSHKTVDNHRANILDKMDARGVVELVRMVLAAKPDLARSVTVVGQPPAAALLSKAS